MQNVLLVESRDSFDRRDGGFCGALACALAGAGDSVTVLLVQNGVLPARASARDPGLASLVAAGVTVLADAFSLSERAIAEHRLAEGVHSAALEVVVDRMIDGWKVLWH
jgi:hypothetical protein